MLFAVMAACTAASLPSGAAVGELTLLSDATLEPAISAAVHRFKQETGQEVAVHYVRAGQVAAAFKPGMDPPDVVVLADDQMDKAIRAGSVVGASMHLLARSGVAIVLRSGAAKADISTEEGLKRTLRQAKSIVHGDPADSPGGAQAAQLIEQLGLAGELRSKTTIASGSNPMGQVAAGPAEVGLHTLHESLGVSGTTVAWRIPDGLQAWRAYEGALATGAPNPDDAQSLLRFLLGPEGQEALLSKGLSSAKR